MTHFEDIYDIAADRYGIIASAQARPASSTAGAPTAVSCGAATACTSSRAGCPRPTTPTLRPWHSWATRPTSMVSPCSPCTAWRWLTRAQSRSQRRNGRSHHVLRGHPLPARVRRHRVLRRLGNARSAPRGRQAGARRGPGHRRRMRKAGEGAGMTKPKTPSSRRNLDLAIDRLCAKTSDEPGPVRRPLATAIVGRRMDDEVLRRELRRAGQKRGIV